jgi:carboxyl-terminal processing protease
MNLQKRNVSTTIALLVLVGASFFSGMTLGKKGYTYSGSEFKIINQNSAPKEVNYGLLWEALSQVNQKYVDRPVDQTELLYGAIRGLVEATGDEYTTFLDPKAYKDLRTELGGSFDGIGAEVGLKKEQKVIVAPLDESPAQKAGLAAGDVILQVNGEDISALTLDETVSKIRGPKGSEVTLNIFRPGTNETKDIKIIRQTISVKSVVVSYKDINGKKIQVIDIQRFGDDTSSEFTKAALEAQRQDVAGIVLDLRNNPGGYLDTAVQVSSFWVDPGQVVVQESKAGGKIENFNASGNNILKGIPTIVLVNQGSASASEIVAGALRDHKLARLVGEKTFGKGSVQELIDLEQGTAVKITIAKWLTPNGSSIHKNGIEPEEKVELTEAQFEAGQDPQMDKALELLK